ncbi:MAG TPA: glycosyltransferase [Methylomirabilota bacterium]|nr:glycosyltransferase [Methylomirabilota bacterium]
MATPAVSVLMGVRNGAPWVAQAIESILAQSLGDLELIVVDDGSTDDTPMLLARTQDPRLAVERQPPSGLTRALGRALARARAPLIARLDADDVARPDRLAEQVAFLARHPEIGLLGSAARVVDAAGREVGEIRPPENDLALRRALIRRNPFVHSSIVARRLLVTRAGGYDPAFAVAQDYDLWLRLAPLTRLANLSQPLVTRRLLPGRVTAAREDERLRAEARARWLAVRRGTYPVWSVVWALRPLAALALPRPVRAALRTALGR